VSSIELPDKTFILAGVPSSPVPFQPAGFSMDVAEDCSTMQAPSQLTTQAFVHSLLRTHAVSPATVELGNQQLAYAT
jgi:hypothetical protein